MSGYYAYFTGDDGRITSRVTILAANDEDAKEQAKRLVCLPARRLSIELKMAFYAFTVRSHLNGQAV